VELCREEEEKREKAVAVKKFATSQWYLPKARHNGSTKYNEKVERGDRAATGRPHCE
jgi:hypothetical protein